MSSEVPHLVIDLETVADDRWSPPPEKPDAIPPVWACRIVAIGCALLDADYRLVRIGTIEGGPDDAGRERRLLEGLDRFVDRSRPVLVTYNGRGFDLPVIAMRAFANAVPLAWYYGDRDVRYRFSESGHLDLCDWMTDHGAARMFKLDDVARLIGLPGKTGVDGSSVAAMYRDGKLAEIERYCLSDVAQTAIVFLRFRLLQGRITRDHYQAAVSMVIQTMEAAEDLDVGRFRELLAGIDRTKLLDREVYLPTSTSEVSP